LKMRRLKDLKSNPGEAGPDLPKPETEWSRFRCKKATVEEDGGEACRGIMTVVAGDREGVSQLFSALLKKPDLVIQTTSGDRQEYGKITRLVVTGGKKPDTIHGVASITTVQHIEDMVSRALKIDSRQMELPAEE
jgi:hypothetical protein